MLPALELHIHRLDGSRISSRDLELAYELAALSPLDTWIYVGRTGDGALDYSPQRFAGAVLAILATRPRRVPSPWLIVAAGLALVAVICGALAVRRVSCY